MYEKEKLHLVMICVKGSSAVMRNYTCSLRIRNHVRSGRSTLTQEGEEDGYEVCGMRER